MDNLQWISKYEKQPPLKKSIIVKTKYGELCYYKRTSDNFYKHWENNMTVNEDSFEFLAEIDLPKDDPEYQSSLDKLLDKIDLDIKMQVWVTPEEYESSEELEAYFYIDAIRDEEDNFIIGMVDIKLEDNNINIKYNNQSVNNSLTFNVEDLRKIVAQYDKKKAEFKIKESSLMLSES